MEQSPALRAMTEAGARRRKIEALKTQMEHLKEELQMVVAAEILMRQEYRNLDSALDLIEEFQNTRNGRQQLFIDSERQRLFRLSLCAGCRSACGRRQLRRSSITNCGKARRSWRS